LPWLLVRFLRDDRRAWLLAAGVFLVLALPWTAYQKFHDPPGHRLLKWHLAGRIEPDPAGVGTALRDAYTARPPAARAAERRRDEFFRLARTLALWPLALLALPLAWPRLRPAWPGARPLLGVTFATILVWCAVMYLPDSAIVHQGSFAVPLVACTACAVVAAAAPWGLAALAVVQAAQFAVTWIPAGTPAVFGPAHPLPVAAGLAAATALVWLLRPAPAPK
jgi:hypothetical protein